MQSQPETIKHSRIARLPQRLLPIREWAGRHYRVLNNDAEFFNPLESPWLTEPLEACDNPGVSTVTFIKPVQTGGTSLGEIALFRAILRGRTTIHYNWPTDEKAVDRWKKFTERRIKACRPVRSLMPTVWEDGFILFTNDSVFSQHGVFTTGNLDSDTVDVVVNEEVHQWDDGMLAKARGRQTRIAFPKFITISNAGLANSDLHNEFLNGTQQHYEVLCPGCGQHHRMRTKWDDNHPELGGLRYDADDCRREDGYDYNKLLPTIRYQFPCGYEMPDDLQTRRMAAVGGRYTEPQNPGALLSNRSYTFEAVACHNIRWLDLIQQKHAALRSLKAGDDEPFRIYQQERESVFYDPENRPFTGGTLTIDRTRLKGREGLADREVRFWAADWQKGWKKKGQMTHFWLVIRDVKSNGDSLLVFEGMVSTEEELASTLDEHGCQGRHGVVDVTFLTKSLQEMCYRRGWGAVQGTNKQDWFRHADKVKRYYSPYKPLCSELGVNAKHLDHWLATGQPHPDEPLMWGYNKAGVISNLFFLRSRTDLFKFDVPGDVSAEYEKQNDSWQRKSGSRGRSNEQIEEWKQTRKDDHMLMCEAYIAMLMDIGGFISARLDKDNQ